MPSNRGLASTDLAAGAAVRAAVFGGATCSQPRRTERPFRHRICGQDAPSMRLGRRSSAGSACASCAVVFDFFLRQTNAPRARQHGLHLSPADGGSTRYDRHDFVVLACHARCVKAVFRDSCLVTRTHFASPRGETCRPGQPGGAGQTAAGPAGSAGEGLDGLAGLAARGPAGRGCRRYEEQTSPETNGRDITSSIFSSLFSSRGQGCPRRAGAAAATASAAPMASRSV